MNWRQSVRPRKYDMAACNMINDANAHLDLPKNMDIS